ncbi:MAG: FHA domain-containing protein [Polyangiaceae bacterium]
MRFRLRYQQHDLELPPGHFIIGRSSECQLSVDDPLVSRRHAKLVVTDDTVTIEDLGSRNGVLVDGGRIEGKKRIRHAQKITIGSQEMVLLDATERASAERNQTAVDATYAYPSALTMTAVPVAKPPASASSGETVPEESERSKKADAFRVLGGVADKALALGRAEEAERILRSLLDQVIQGSRSSRRNSPEVVDQAARYAARLAGATGKGTWFDYVIELYDLERRIMPAAIVDELYVVLRKVDNVSLAAIRTYLDDLRDLSGAYGPADRFVLQRIEGLSQLVALK